MNMTKESHSSPPGTIEKNHFMSSARRRRIAVVNDESVGCHSPSPFPPSRHSAEIPSSPFKHANHSLYRSPARTSPRKGQHSKLRLGRVGTMLQALILIAVTVSSVISLWSLRNVRMDLEEKNLLRNNFFHLKEKKDLKHSSKLQDDSKQSRKRIVFHSIPAWDHHEEPSRWFEIDQSLAVSPGQESPSQPDFRYDIEGGNFKPMQPWQTESFPTCNTIHEYDLQQHGGYSSFQLEDRGHGRKILTRTNSPITNSTGIHEHHETDEVAFMEDTIFILGRGWFRHTWKMISGSSLESAVLKTLRFNRDFMAEYYELHRREAMAMERLTKSPYIINIYAACGPSAVNEFADFIPGFHNFREFAKQLRDRDEEHVLKLKLQIATMIALGVQHIHEIDGPGNATMVHYDINPMNVAITFGGIPKLNDFNVAEFLLWDTKKNESRPFVGRLKEPWWRAPEEMHDKPLLDEKVDVYSLGNILYYLLTGHSPRGQVKAERVEEQRENVKNGIPPKIPKKYTTSENPATIAMVKAIYQCYIPNPKDRKNARDVASGLLDAFNDMRGS